MIEAPSTGTQAEHTLPDLRRRSMQLTPGQHDKVHRRLPYLFIGSVPGSVVPDDAEDDGSDDEQDIAEEVERRENFLGRAQSYAKLMHAHTKYQLGSPATRTLPGYTRTMHAFTLDQLSHHRTTSVSERSSPQLGMGGRNLLLPSKICTELEKLSLDDPPAPSNTSELGHGVELRRVKRRSMTEPLLRDFAMSVDGRDFAAT
ncbi:hypothetical protein LTR36_000493 [Oleoguttula mirabilis]|uniref:Uncharacterized protein n=1 Tax=Oleoguttula mirabilis TaxID=1507867 RepID=A0AAV9JQ32_9PEZI|nr:hypothetical protein LTR36_000493 [Oleoguttula mirabilis]